MEMFTTGQCSETESRVVVSLVWGLMVGFLLSWQNVLMMVLVLAVNIIRWYTSDG